MSYNRYMAHQAGQSPEDCGLRSGTRDVLGWDPGDGYGDPCDPNNQYYDPNYCAQQGPPPGYGGGGGAGTQPGDVYLPASISQDPNAAMCESLVLLGYPGGQLDQNPQPPLEPGARPIAYKPINGFWGEGPDGYLYPLFFAVTQGGFMPSGFFEMACRSYVDPDNPPPPGTGLTGWDFVPIDPSMQGVMMGASAHVAQILAAKQQGSRIRSGARGKPLPKNLRGFYLRKGTRSKIVQGTKRGATTRAMAARAATSQSLRRGGAPTFGPKPGPLQPSGALRRVSALSTLTRR